VGRSAEPPDQTIEIRALGLAAVVDVVVAAAVAAAAAAGKQNWNSRCCRRTVGWIWRSVIFPHHRWWSEWEELVGVEFGIVGIGVGIVRIVVVVGVGVGVAVVVAVAVGVAVGVGVAGALRTAGRIAAAAAVVGIVVAAAADDDSAAEPLDSRSKRIEIDW